MQPLQQWWSRLFRARRGAAGAGTLGVLLVVLLAVTAFASSRAHSSGPNEVTIAPIPTIVATSSAEGAPTPGPTDTGVPTLHTLKELKDRLGDPPPGFQSVGRFVIPRIGVDAPIGVRAVPASLDMVAPTGPSDVVLYDFSVDPRFGGTPGSGANAIFSGHVDYSYKLPYANANYTGEGVFYSLRLLTPDDTIEVVMNGKTLTYDVQWVRSIVADGGNWGSLLSHDVGGDAITLVTCDGTFNPTTKEYNARTVVRATRTS